MKLPVSYSDVFNVKKHNFNEIALEIFRYQSQENSVYRNFLNHVECNPDEITHFEDIPYLPIAFFKTHQITTGNWITKTSKYYESSSTTGLNTSKHYINDANWYNQSFTKGFERVYGDVTEWCIVALLPNYLENEHSSLIAMVDQLITLSENKDSGYYLDKDESLHERLRSNESEGKKTLLIGVSFALLDLQLPPNQTFEHLTILETGGMKGRQKELTRAELHMHISTTFPGAKIHSEYGMTELFSQAYMTDENNFVTPPWMHVSLSELDDPFKQARFNKTGLIRIIDLANIETCSFIATSDVGKMHKDDSFEVLGRYDYSEQRGCNLLIA